MCFSYFCCLSFLICVLCGASVFSFKLNEWKKVYCKSIWDGLPGKYATWITNQSFFSGQLPRQISSNKLFLENFCSKLLHPLFGHFGIIGSPEAVIHNFLEIWDIQLQIHCLHWQTLDISKCGIVIAAVLEVHTALRSRWWSFGQGWSVFNWALDTSAADAGHTLRTLVSRCRRRMILVEGPRAWSTVSLCYPTQRQTMF